MLFAGIHFWSQFDAFFVINPTERAEMEAKALYPSYTTTTKIKLGNIQTTLRAVDI